eukprot:scaffold918_cov126-Cylindrotheca_fusiformis.AAC.67
MNPKQQKQQTNERQASPEADEVWMQRFQELTLYFEENGHSLVPQHYNRNKKLGGWVAAQRKYRRLLQKTGKSNQMTCWKIQQLDSLEFCWYVGKGINPVNRKQWIRSHKEQQQQQQQQKKKAISLNDKDMELARLIASFPNHNEDNFSKLLMAAAADTSSSPTTTSTASTPHTDHYERMKEYLTTISTLQQDIAKLQQETIRAQTDMDKIQKHLKGMQNE